MSIPILPPEESQRMGYPVIAALEARVADAESRCLHAAERGLLVEFGILTAMKLTYEDALKLVRAAHRAYGGD